MYKGKSILVYLLVMASMLSYSQNPIVNKFRDSTWFAKGVRFDSAIYLIKGASNGKVLTSDASGRATWQTFSASGVTQQALNDSIARLDSTINAIPSPNLQQVTDADNITTRSISIVDEDDVNIPKLFLGKKIPNKGSIKVYNSIGNSVELIIDDNCDKQYEQTFPNKSGVFALSVNNISANSEGDIVFNYANSDSLAQIRQEISDTATQIRSEIPDVSNFATTFNLADTSALLRSLIPATATFTISKNSAKDSIVTVFNGIRSAVKDSVANLTNYVTTSSTSTLTNKRITVRVDSTTSSATPTINTDNVDTYKLTAQAADITSFTTNLSGTPTDDQILHIVIIGTATRAITWGSKFEASTVALPTTTVGTDRLDVYFIWNTNTSKWRCGGVW